MSTVKFCRVSATRPAVANLSFSDGFR